MSRTTEPLEGHRGHLRFDRATQTLHARRYEVRITAGPDSGRAVTLDGPLVIGTQENAGLRLTDGTVSRLHVELWPRADGVRVKDLDSRNGTFVAGVRVQEVILEQNNTLSVGKTSFQVGIFDEDLGPSEGEAFGRLFGKSAPMRRLLGVLEKVAASDAPVLLTGETGTGKGLIAESLHRASPRARGPFVLFDCGAVTPSLAQSELFGHAKGAFTGAVGERTGAFLEANGGTLFLDEVGELPLDVQPLLLRALESGVVHRLGENRSRSVDVRAIAATHRDLEAMVRQGTFRQDLYYRLAVVLLQVPPLRERLDDIPLLVQQLVEASGQGPLALSPELERQLVTYGWPGNVRELRNVVERVLAGTSFDPIPGAARPALPVDIAQKLPFKEAKEHLVEAFTREYFVALFARCDGNLSRMAREAGIARSYLHKLVERYALKPTAE